MKFSGTITAQDFYNGDRLIYSRNRRRWLLRLIGAYLLITPFLFFDFSLITLLGIIIGFFFITFEYVILRWVSKKKYSNHVKMNLFHLSYKVDATGISHHSLLRESHIKWEAFSDYFYDDNGLMLSEVGGFPRFIPRSFFSSKKEWEKFLAFVAKYLPLKK